MLFSKGDSFNGTLFLKQAWQADILLLLFSDPNSPFDHSSQILFSKCQMHIIRHFCKWDCVRNLCHLVNDSFNIFGQVFTMLQLRQNVKNMQRKKNMFQIFMTIWVQYLYYIYFPVTALWWTVYNNIIYGEKYLIKLMYLILYLIYLKCTYINHTKHCDHIFIRDKAN